MKKRILLILSLIVLINLIIVNAQTITKDDLFTELLLNNGDKKTAIFEFNNIGNQPINKNNFGITFNEVCGKVLSYDLLAYQSCPKEIEYQNGTKLNCKYFEQIIDNKTLETEIIEDCLEVPTYSTKTIYVNDYCKFTELPTGKTELKIDNVKIKHEDCGNGWGYKVDWIPRVIYDSKEYVNIDWAWWNSTYNRKINLTNVPDVDLLLYINGSGGFNGTFIMYNPNDCDSTISLYYKDTNQSDYKIVCNDTTDITTPNKPSKLIAYYGLDTTSEYYNNYDLGVSTGSPTLINGCAVNDCYLYDGNDEHNATTDSAWGETAQANTIMLWYNVSVAYSGDDIRRIINTGTGTGNGWTLGIGQHTAWTGGQSVWQGHLFGGGTEEYSGQASAYKVGWNMFSVSSASSTSHSYYFNDSLINTRTNNDDADNSDYQFNIGRGWSSEWWQGYVDELSIWNESLTHAEISTYYNNTKDIPSNSLLDTTEIYQSPTSDVPTITDVTIYPSSPLTNDTILNCSALPLDDDNNLDVYFYWNKNDVLQGGYNATVSTTNNTITYTSAIVNETLTANDNWTCNAKAFDTLNYSAVGTDSVIIGLHPDDNQTALNFDCEYNPKPNIKYLNNIKWLCAINCTTINCTTYKCYTYVKFMDDIIQINPKQTEISDIGLIDYYTAEPQNENQQYVSVYFTATDLRNDEPLNFSVVCAGDDRILKFTQELTPQYKDFTDIPDRAVWFMDNTTYIIAAIFMFVLVFGIFLILLRGVNQ